MGFSGKKKIVESFYNSNFYKNPDEIKNFLHPEAELFWNSSAGFSKMHYNDIVNLGIETSRSFDSLRAEISHLLKEKEEITIRFTYYVRTVENPDEEIPLAHFIAIWTLKEDKMYRGFQISQLADETPENLSSFITTNF